MDHFAASFVALAILFLALRTALKHLPFRISFIRHLRWAITHHFLARIANRLPLRQVDRLAPIRRQRRLGARRPWRGG